MASLGGRLRDLVASLRISSVLRSRILVSSATIAATSATTAPLAIMSAMNFSTAPRSGAIALVIGGSLSLGADTARAAFAATAAEWKGNSTSLTKIDSHSTRGAHVRARRPSLTTSGSAQVDPFEHEQQLGGLDDRATLLGGPGDAVGALLEALCDQNVPVAIPVQHAHAVGSPREEHVHGARQRVLGELRPHQDRQSVDALATIDARRRDEHSHARRQRQHPRPRRATTSTRSPT